MRGSSDVITFVATTDLTRARTFYEHTLGLGVVSDEPGDQPERRGLAAPRGAEQRKEFPRRVATPSPPRLVGPPRRGQSIAAMTCLIRVYSSIE